jgi:hypothetical protein
MICINCLRPNDVAQATLSRSTLTNVHFPRHRGNAIIEKLLGEFFVQNGFLREQKEEQTSGQDVLLAVESVEPSLVVDDITPLALNQYVDFDSECSGLFGDHDIEAAKRLMKEG